MRKRAIGRQFTMRKSDGVRVRLRTRCDGVRVHHKKKSEGVTVGREKKSDGVRGYHKRERWGESCP